MKSPAPPPEPPSTSSSGERPTPDAPQADEAPLSEGRREFLKSAGWLVVAGAAFEAIALSSCGFRFGVNCGECTRECTACTQCTGCTTATAAPSAPSGSPGSNQSNCSGLCTSMQTCNSGTACTFIYGPDNKPRVP